MCQKGDSKVLIDRSIGRKWRARTGSAVALAASLSLIVASEASAQGATPQLTKAFTPSQVEVGENTTLEFTITNPLASAQTWSFTDQLVEGLEVAQSTALSNTCTSSSVTAPLGGRQIQISGQVPASGSCVVRIRLMATLPGTHENAASNITQRTNISGPATPAAVQCDPAADPPTEDVSGVFLDCDFSNLPPANDFTIKQDWQSSADTIAYQTPVVGDIYGTGDPAVVVGANRTATGGNPVTSRLARDVKIYDGATGATLDTITTPRYTWSSFSTVTIADVDDDGTGEIIFRAASHSQTQADADAIGVPTAADVNGRLIAYKYDPLGDDWDVMWVSDERYDHGPASPGIEARGGASLSVADFNGDGTPEAYVGNQIFNAETGVRLAAGAANDLSGCQVGNSCLLAQSVAFDRDGDGDLELAAGWKIFDVQITNPNGEAGNSFTVAESADLPSTVNRDGFTAVADMDLDGGPEVVVTIAGNNTVVYVWDALTGEVEDLKLGSQLAGGTGGGPPMIGDIDGDERPEIVMVTVNRLRALELVPGVGLVQQWIMATADSSGGTSMSMFDFNSDGEQEIVYRDEQNIRIIDGGDTPPNTTNRNLATFSCGSGTSVDMPVIADINGTGEARIVVTCNVGNSAAVRAYETDSFAWANTRPVWNQQAYFVTHINNDLTVPTQQFPNWTVFNDPDQRCSDGANRPLNNFQVQVTDLDPETGCPVICVRPALEVDKTADPPEGTPVEPGDTVEYTVTIENPINAIPDVDLTDDLSDVLDDADVTDGPTVSPGGAGTAQITGTDLVFNGTIPGGGTVTITYEVTVKPKGQLGNRQLGNAVVSEFSNCDGTPNRLRCTTEHPVSVPETDLELEKSGGPQVVSPGGQVAYTLTVTNNGPDDSAGSTVTDNLPSGLSNVAVPANCNVQASTVTCDVGPLADGDSADIAITADAPNTPATCFENDASVEAADDDLVSGNDSPAPVRICTSPAADLELEKTSTPSIVSPGGQVTYTLTVTNNGPQDSSGSIVTDDLPTGLSNVQVPGNCQHAGSEVTCTVGALAASDSTDIVITADAPATPATCFDNEASVAIDQAAPDEGDPDLDNNESGPVRSCTTPVADLEISKSGPANVDTGGQVTYSLTITNNGPQDSSGSIVTDDLPTGLSNVQVPGNCQLVGSEVTCTVGALAVNDSVALLITADAPDTPGTCFTNKASVDADQTPPAEGDSDPSNNESEEVRTCIRESDLELTKTVDPEIVDPGGQVEYTLTVTNSGPSDSPGSTVTDDLPAGLTNVSAPQNCQLQGQTVICNVGPLADGDSTEIVITADAPGTPATCFENDAVVAGTSDPTPANDDASARACTTPASDLELEKSAPAEVDPGGLVTWTLTVTNNGAQASSGSTVTDKLPAGITNIQVPGSCALQDQDVTCDVGSLPTDGSVEFVITGDAPNLADECFSNDASVEIDGDAPDEVDPDPDNNNASVQTCTNEGADLVTEKTAEQGPFAAGDSITYTLAVTNDGPAAAHDVQVEDDLPDSLSLVSATPEQGTCNSSDPIECDLGTIAPNGSVEIEIVASIASDQQGAEIENTACATGTEPDPDDSNDCSTETIEVDPEADVSIEKTAAAGTYFAGDDVTFTLSVTNDGPNDASNVEVSDDLPNSLTLVSATPDQGTCGATDPLTCDLGTIADGATVEITVVATIANDQAGRSIDNEACVAADEADPDGTDDCSTETVDVEPESDLEVSKSAEQGPFFAGDEVTYTVTVTNNGPNDATNASVTDDLPDTLTLVSATPDQGTCSATDPITCDLGTISNGASVEIEIVAEIDADQTNASIDNTACALRDESDPDDSNDCDTETIQTEPEADLEIEKDVSPGGAVKVGDELTYTLTVTNNGPNAASNVVVGDEFSDAVQVNSATPSQGTCTQTAPISCDLGAIPAAGQVTITIIALPLDRGTLDNTATVDGDEADPDPTNNSDDATVKVKRVKVEIKKVANHSKADPGDVIRYEIKVSSKTDVPLEDLTMCDKLPAQLKLISAPGAQVNGKTACWTFDLPPNGSATFVVKAEAKGAPSERKVINTARVEGIDILPERDKEDVLVAPDEGDVSPEPCPGRAAARC